MDCEFIHPYNSFLLVNFQIRNTICVIGIVDFVWMITFCSRFEWCFWSYALLLELEFVLFVQVRVEWDFVWLKTTLKNKKLLHWKVRQLRLTQIYTAYDKIQRIQQPKIVNDRGLEILVSAIGIWKKGWPQFWCLNNFVRKK